MRSLFAVMGEWSLLSGASKHSSAPSLRDTLRRRNSDLLRLPDKVPELGTVCRVKTSDVRGRYVGVTWALRGRYVGVRGVMRVPCGCRLLMRLPSASTLCDHCVAMSGATRLHY